MSVATHLKILSSFERWARGHDPVTALLEEVLAYVKVDVTNAIALRLYHLNEHGVQVGASTIPPRASQVFMNVGDDTAYREALSQRQPMLDPQRETWIVPLNSVSTTYGVLEVSVGVEHTNGKSADELFERRRDWLALIAAYLSQTLDTRALQELSRRQALVSSALTQATRYTEIVEILAEHFLDDKQFVTINQFLTDTEHNVTGIRVLASANRHQTFDVEQVLDGITIEAFGYPVARIIDEARPFIVYDIPNNETIHPKVKAWMAGFKIKSVCVFPLRSQGRTFGFIALNSVGGPLYLAEPELAAYQSLTDQVSTLIQLGRVTAQAGFTLAVSERQKQAFNELIAGQDFPEMAGIIARHMLPDSGRFLAIAEITYDSHGVWSGWRLLASANRRKSYRWEEIDTPVALTDLATPFSQSLRDGEPMMIIDVTTSDGITKLGEPFATWLRDHRVRSFLSVPVILNDRPIAALSVAGREPMVLTIEEINAFTSLAGQMGVLVQVRYLLEQARTARNLVDNLVLANRLVAIAADERFMAQSITYTLARNLKGAVVTLFDRPLSEGQQPHNRRIVGLSSGETLVRIDGDVRRADLPSLAQLSQLHNGQPVIVADLTHDSGFFTEETRVQLLDLSANWVASFGIRSTNRLIGTLDILNDKPYTFTAEEIDGYTSLADQIGITIRSRQLLQQSQAAQLMATQLVQANILISTAENFEEMALAVVSTLPESIDLTAILLFNDPISLNETPEWIKVEVVATRESAILHPEAYDYFKPKPGSSSREVYGLDEILSGVMLMIEDLGALERTIIDGLTTYLEQYNLRSVAAIGLRTGIRFLGVIAFGARDLRQLDDLQRENLRAIAGEVAVAIENRLLVQQTADALTFVAQQYYVSNALYRAQTPEALLAALYQFMQEHYTNAELTLFGGEDGHYRTVVEINANGEIGTFRRTGALLPNQDQAPNDDTQRLMTEEVIITESGHNLLLPLLTTDRTLLGTLEFHNSAHPVNLSPNTLRALRGLADQMTTGLQNRLLLQQTETALQETRRLYSVNQALLTTNDMVQVLQAFREIIAPDADQIAVVSLGYDLISDDINLFKLEAFLSSDIIQQPERDYAAEIGSDALHLLKTDWSERGNEVQFIENAEQSEVSRPILNFYQSLGYKVSSYAIIPLFEDGVLGQLFIVSYRERRYFDPSVRRLLSAIRDQMAIVLQNQRLIRDTRASAAQLGSQVRVLQTLNQLAINLSITQDEQALLFDACAAAYTALRVDRVGIVTLNIDGEYLTVAAEYPYQSEAFGTVFSVYDEIQQTLLRDRAPLILNNLEHEKRFRPDTLEALLKQGIRSILLIPLVDSQDVYYGSIGLSYFKGDRVFTPDMVSIARSIAAQTVISLQNNRQVQRVRQQAQQLQQLARFSQALQLTLEVPSVLDTLATFAPEILAHDHLAVLLYDQRTGKLRLVLENNRRMNQFVPIDLEITTSGAAWTRRDLVHVANTRKQTQLYHTFHAAMMSILAAPVFARGIALGVVEIASYTPHLYTETDVLVFRQLVNQIGVALENAETYSQSQRLAKSKALVNDISNQIQKQVELDGILNVTMNELGRALGAKQARIQLGTQPDPKANDTMEQW